MNLGEFVKYMRKSRGYTQVEMSKLLFIAPCTLSHYESSTRMMPFNTFKKAMDICNYNLKIIDCIKNKDITDEEMKRYLK